MHRDSESAEQTQRGVQQNPGGMFHGQLARRDDAAKLFDINPLLDYQGECCSGEKVELFER